MFLIRNVLIVLTLFAALCCPGPANAVILDVQAYIDGRDRLHFQGGSLWWEHFDYAAVGRHVGDYTTNLTVDSNPTIYWLPNWPGHPFPDQIYSTYAISDAYTGLSPALPAMAQTVGFTSVSAREYAGIVSQPDAGNGYELVVEFNDNGYGGSTWYEVKLEYTAVPLPPSVLLLGSGLLGLAGWRRFRKS
jgi:hypothetical protein